MHETREESLLLWLGRALYVAAVLVLLAGILGIAGLLNFTSNLPTMFLFVQALGSQQLIDQIFNVMRSGINSIAGLLAVVTLLLSALCYACGRLLLHVRSLKLQNRQLEERLAVGTLVK